VEQADYSSPSEKAPIPNHSATGRTTASLPSDYPFWDALILAAAKSLSCRFLLTEDLQAGQDFEGVLVVNPFVSDPSSLTVRSNI
jgi:predicted nucleic acid-binding protein